jgi:DNA adenine methylase
MVELDDAVAAVWEAVVGGDAAWLADRVLHFQMSREAVLEELQTDARLHAGSAPSRRS